MTTGWLTDPRYLDHDTGASHPERPARLRAVIDALAQAGLLDSLVHLRARPAIPEDVLAIHTPQYVTRLNEACRSGARYLDVPDSAICPASCEVALLAAGGVVAACEAVLAGQVRNAFCAVRPPGHHAEADRSMGFCLLNNVAIAARALRRRHGLERVFILDWDVHHGNGTQQIFELDPSVYFCSLHEHPGWLYPGTGYAWERGEGPGAGATLNIPMPPHAGDEHYADAFERKIWPAIRAFRPQFMLISVGFDAHLDDPLATLDVTDAGYEMMTREALKMAGELCEGRLVSVLEGGYNLEVLQRNAVRHVELLMAEPD